MTSLPRILVPALILWLAGPTVPLCGSTGEKPEALLETGSFAPPLAPPAGRDLRVVTYNIHGPFASRFESVAEALETEDNIRDADVFALQEVNRNRRESGQRDVAEDLARRLKLHYVYAVELEYEGDGERGLALLSRYPILDPVRFVLPGDGPGGRHRIGVGGTIRVGDVDVRVYNTHLETRISGHDRRRQIEAVLEHAEQYSELPTVIVGDFNTWKPGSRGMMFDVMEARGFACPLRADKVTFVSKLVVRLKLDWIWLRGVDPIQADVEGSVKASDHRPLWVTLDLLSSLPGNERAADE